MTDNRGRQDLIDEMQRDLSDTTGRVNDAMKRLLAALKPAGAPVSQDEIAATIANNLIYLRRLLARLAGTPTLAVPGLLDDLTRIVDDFQPQALRPLRKVLDVRAPTDEEIHSLALRDGPALWQWQRRRLCSYFAITRRTFDEASVDVESLRTLCRFFTQTSNVAEHPEAEQKMIDAHVAVTSLFEHIADLDATIEDLDAQDDLVGVRETVRARTEFVRIRESLVDIINAAPGPTADHYWR